MTTTDATTDYTTTHTDPPTAPPSDAIEIHPKIITAATALGLLITVLVGAASFTQSFSTLYDLARLAENIADPWVTPLVLDGPILAAGVIRIALSQHTDPATVRGRRFVVAILLVAGGLSMAGNAYHTMLLGSGALHTAVAAGIGALAPLMVMVMSEIVAVILRAPRRRTVLAAAVDTTAVDTAAAHTVPASNTLSDNTDEPNSAKVDDQKQRELASVFVDDDPLGPEVWQVVNLYHNDPVCAKNFSAVARALGTTHVSTVTRRYDKWLTWQLDVAAAKGAAPQHDPHNTGTDTGSGTGGAQLRIGAAGTDEPAGGEDELHTGDNDHAADAGREGYAMVTAR